MPSGRMYTPAPVMVKSVVQALWEGFAVMLWRPGSVLEMRRMNGNDAGKLIGIELGERVEKYPKLEWQIRDRIAELEKRLSPERWVRIHRATLLNVDAVKELRTWFGGRLLLRLKDGRTDLQVARDRAAEVRAKLGL